MLLIGEVESKTAKNNNPYLSTKGQDKFGSANILCWTEKNHPQLLGAKGKVVNGMFKVDEYQGSLQLKLEQIVEVVEFEDLPKERQNLFCRTAYVDQKEWVGFYLDKVEPLIEDEPIKKIIEAVLTSPDLGFFSAPAARGMHHNFRGGLSEHVFNLLHMYLALLEARHPYISKTRRGLVIAGLILHDFAKALEYEETSPGSFQTARFGDLMGHLAGGPVLLQRIASAKGIKMDQELWMHFNHVLLAHHGEVDWGSPIRPATPEAILVHHLDNTDGKMFMVAETKDGEWNKGLQTRVRHFVPTEV